MSNDYQALLMEAELSKVEWIVKNMLLDESVATDELAELMTKQGINSFHLLNYINDDEYWPKYSDELTKKVDAKDEKYIIDFSNPRGKQENNTRRELLKEAVHKRFYTGHKFNEWLV